MRLSLKCFNVGWVKEHYQEFYTIGFKIFGGYPTTILRHWHLPAKLHPNFKIIEY